MQKPGFPSLYTAPIGLVRAELLSWHIHQETPSDTCPEFTSMGTHCSPLTGW